MSTVAGLGEPGHLDAAIGAQALFWSPMGLAVGPALAPTPAGPGGAASGRAPFPVDASRLFLYVADSGNHVIRTVGLPATGAAAAPFPVASVAGGGPAGEAGGGLTDSPLAPTAARFRAPSALAAVIDAATGGTILYGEQSRVTLDLWM